MLYLCCSSVIQVRRVRGLLPIFHTQKFGVQHGNQKARMHLPDSSSIPSVVRGVSGAYMASTSFAKLAPSSDTVKAVTFGPKSAIMFLWIHRQSALSVGLFLSIFFLASQPTHTQSSKPAKQTLRVCAGGAVEVLLSSLERQVGTG